MVYTYGATTLSTLTLGITTLWANSRHLSKRLSAVTFNSHIQHYSIECRYAECWTFIVMQCRYAECRYAECRYAEYRYAECRYADCRSANFLDLTSNVRLGCRGINICNQISLLPLSKTCSCTINKHSLVIYGRKKFYSWGPLAAKRKQKGATIFGQSILLK